MSAVKQGIETAVRRADATPGMPVATEALALLRGLDELTQASSVCRQAELILLWTCATLEDVDAELAEVARDGATVLLRASDVLNGLQRALAHRGGCRRGPR